LQHISSQKPNEGIKRSKSYKTKEKEQLATKTKPSYEYQDISEKAIKEIDGGCCRFT
jgi:hypothetical protein